MFGARIIGKKQFEEQKRKERECADIYGPRVSGIHKNISSTDPVEGPKSQRRRGRSNPQPGAPDPDALEPGGRMIDPEGGDDDLAGVDTNDNGVLSEAEIRDALESRPELYQRLLESEFERESGPRKGVSRLLLSHEQNHREGGPREDVVGRLTAVLEG